ncbi:F-box domain-containing protein [Artemisia annua]|uniref:F-box domain-containing protein n=1 Tax=Artemisia annua TaxID=35608 RepID=A0A2U1NPQ0_ARTAN|nr:F-box domain-containing protein [Artemisia annua]
MSDNIPLDVQLDIMNRLPVKTILQLRSVSKILKANIDSHAFIKAYGAKDSADCLFCLTFDQGYKGYMCSVDSKLTITSVDTHMNLAAMTPVGSCSGITRFLYGGNVMAVLWNPSLRKSVCAFIPYYTNQIECSKISFGFGVRPDTLDPTIVKVSYPVFHSGFCQFHVIEIPSLLKVVMPMPFSLSGLGNSVIISGMIMTSAIPLFCAWRLEVDGASITRFSNLFGIPTPMVNKLIGFTSNESPIVEANVGHILGHSIFVYILLVWASKGMLVHSLLLHTKNLSF